MRRKKNAVLSWILSVVVAVTFMPLAGTVVYADDSDYTYEDEVVSLSAAEVKAEKKKAEAKLKEELGVIDADEVQVGVGEAAEEQADIEAQAEPADNAFKAQASYVMKTPLKDEKGLITVTPPDSAGEVLVTGAELSTAYPEYKYTGLYVDDIDYESEVAEMNDTMFTQSISMGNYDVGVHTVIVEITKETDLEYDVQYIEVDGIPTYIYDTPSNALKYYTTGVNYIKCEYPDSDYIDDDLSLVLEYRKGAKGKWTQKAKFTNTRKAGGLKANTTYYVRLVYVKDVEFNGVTYRFSGADTGCVSNAKKLLTAYKKPKVKKIDITKVKTIVHKYRVRYATRYTWRVNKRTGYRRLIRVTPLYHTYRYTYTRFKVNVKFAKKQKVAGICIRTIHGLYAWKGGDKKAYAQTFTVSGKKKGKKISVSVQSYRSNVYGGYSGKYRKKVRCL